MIRLPLVAAAAIACSIGTTPVFARDGYGYHRDHARHAPQHGFRHDHRGHLDGPRYWVSTPRPYRHYAPYWVPAPVYAYPLYEPAPVVVERVYEPRRFYEVERFERVEPREQRSYAQVTPPPAQPAPMQPTRPVAPAPRLERYTLSAKELFDFDKATLRGAQPKLDEIAQAMKRHPEIDGVTITGHTDRIGTEAYNLKLSQRRADAVKAYLVAKGVQAQRLTAVGKGESQPVVQCSDTAQAALIRCLEPNRRVEVEQITIEQRAR